ncbi:MAG: translation initiation factor IF-2 [Candidatus Methanospirareceae archaeon]
MKEMNKRIRTPIVAVLGHIDHGKTTLLDTIRGSAVAEKEVGRITQHIGATEIPIEWIKKICQPLKRDWTGIDVPGLLFIDTPGHYAFASLRKRGSALADIAILVVDVIEGFQSQTYESLSILRMFKTPFVIALNKIDKIKGWNSRNKPFVINYAEQNEYSKRALDELVYEAVGELYDKGFSADRYDRIRDFSRNVSIVPVSAKTGEGIPDLLLVLIGLSQKFLEKSLHLHVEEAGVGTILEKKEEKGLGTTIDVILYDGKLKVGDTIAIGSIEGEPIVTRVKALLKPEALHEIRVEKKFKRVEAVRAASGVKIVASSLENALPGSQIRVIEDESKLEEVLKEIRKDIEAMRIETSAEGIIIKADTIGSLEAFVMQLKEEGVDIKKAEVGDISKRDVVEAAMVKDDYMRVIFGFNVNLLPDAKEAAMQNDVHIFMGNVIYKLIEDYKEWVNKKWEEERRKKLETLTMPAKIKILERHIFRQSKPAIVGVEVMAGKIKPGVPLIRADGASVGAINEIQDKGNSIKEASQGMQVAISIKGAIVGKHIKENDILYADMREEEMREIEELKVLSADEEMVLEELRKIKRKR